MSLPRRLKSVVALVKSSDMMGSVREEIGRVAYEKAVDVKRITDMVSSDLAKGYLRAAIEQNPDDAITIAHQLLSSGKRFSDKDTAELAAEFNRLDPHHAAVVFNLSGTEPRTVLKELYSWFDSNKASKENVIEILRGYSKLGEFTHDEILDTTYRLGTCRVLEAYPGLRKIPAEQIAERAMRLGDPEILDAYLRISEGVDHIEDFHILEEILLKEKDKIQSEPSDGFCPPVETGTGV